MNSRILKKVIQTILQKKKNQVNLKFIKLEKTVLEKQEKINEFEYKRGNELFDRKLF